MLRILFYSFNFLMMFKYTKVVLINVCVYLTLIIGSDLIFGYWFKEYNFGPQLRGKRIQKIIFNHNNEKTTYLRDFYGFRENNNIYEKYDASKIKNLQYVYSCIF